tara:strand:+ start:1032 stop:1721 length:690 start_codon:yes stop_codon:yes gene_type:complete
MIKKAIILSAGFGKRLNPLTLNYPKPLLKIGKETLLSNTIKFLEKLEIKEAIINVHYLGNQISEYIRKNKFNLNIKVINEEKEILDTGGGILNALKYLDENFICINPDTIWNSQYIEEFKSMEGNFFLNEKKCNLLVVDKLKSFDKNLKGDFNLESGLVSRKEGKDAKYIFTGLQIINSKVFTNINDKVFSVNKIWNELIKNKELFGLESNVNFLHVSTLDIYNKLNIK